MSNIKLAAAMENGIAKGSFERGKGFCLRACRQAGEKVYGVKYDRLFRGDGTQRDATAARAGMRFLSANLGFHKDELSRKGGLQPGDMLVKTKVAPNRWGDYSGHIGIVTVDGKRVGENSSTSVGRVHGALGFRSLAQYGDYDIVVRLPSLDEEPRDVPAKQIDEAEALCVWNGKAFHALFDENERPYILLAEVIEAMNQYVQVTTNRLDQNPPRFYVRSHPKPK